MTFPIDFWTHPKVARLSDAAFRAFVESNGHSRMRETDGVIEAEDAEFLWSVEALSELVKSHPSRPLMLRSEADYYVLRDYAEHQFTKADRDELTEKRSRAGKASADKRRATVEHMLNTSEHPATEIEKGTGKETEVGTEVDGYVSSEIADATPRPEINQLLDLLDSEIRSNGGRIPTRTKKNRDAIRLLIDKDGVRPDQIERAIRWCQADEFWRGNILSASKLREKYDQLRLAAQRSQPAPKLARADENAADYYRFYGGDDEGTGSVQALDPGIG
jgi:hypothetical protein